MEPPVSMKWKTITEKPVPDIREFVTAAVREGDRLVHIGTDSLQGRRYTQFVTVLVILEPGKGGRVAYQRQMVPRISSLRERLLKEVWLSVTLALEINGVLPASAPLTVHIDANPVASHRSSLYVQELVGMVVGQGFKAAIKPEAWAATHTADYVVRALGRATRVA
jgi:predicted RNase H-related nuclease YkuK (DUF458 family)